MEDGHHRSAPHSFPASGWECIPAALPHEHVRFFHSVNALLYPKLKNIFYLCLRTGPVKSLHLEKDLKIVRPLANMKNRYNFFFDIIFLDNPIISHSDTIA
jgi:hypothetical protein